MRPMTPDTRTVPGPIAEEQVILAFHSFMQGALAQAHAEHLLSADILASAEADIQITAPSVALYLAALRSEGNPPYITTPHVRLTQDNCPVSFRNWFKLWQDLVPQVQDLEPDYQHDLARMLCDLEAETQPFRLDLPRMAQNFKAIAIEISQRRTFQERFNDDLQYAIESGYWGKPATLAQRVPSARFKPPPVYEDSAPAPAPPLTPTPGIPTTVAGSRSDVKVDPYRNTSPTTGLPLPPSPPKSSSPAPRTPPLFNTAPLHLRAPQSPKPNPSAPANAIDPTLALIRETLFAALADVLYSTPSLIDTMKSPHSTAGELSRAYYAAVCLAILEVCLREVDPQTGRVHVVTLGRNSPTTLGLDDCPTHLRPLMVQLGHIAVAARIMAEGDDTRAMRLATLDWTSHHRNGSRGSRGSRGDHGDEDDHGVPRMERLRDELEKGANWQATADQQHGSTRPESPKGEVRALANRINGLALRFTQIDGGGFTERERELFEVLVPELKANATRRMHRAS